MLFRALLGSALVCLPFNAHATKYIFNASSTFKDGAPIPATVTLQNCTAQILDAADKPVMQDIKVPAKPGEEITIILRPDSAQALAGKKASVFCTGPTGDKGVPFTLARTFQPVLIGPPTDVQISD